MITPLRELYSNNTREAKLMLWMLIGFLLIYFLPAGTARFDNAVLEGVRLTHWYAREHVILCLLPAFLIAVLTSILGTLNSSANLFKW